MQTYGLNNLLFDNCLTHHPTSLFTLADANKSFWFWWSGYPEKKLNQPIMVIIWDGEWSIFSWFEMIQNTPPASTLLCHEYGPNTTRDHKTGPCSSYEGQPALRSRIFNLLGLKESEEPKAATWPSNSPDPKAIQDFGMLIYPLPDELETKRTQWQLSGGNLGEICSRICSPGAIWSMKTPKTN